MRLFVIQDGIKNIGCITLDGKQKMYSNFYLITYDFKSNEGYIEKKNQNSWKLYTQVGQIMTKKRDYYFSSFNECVMKLEELKGNNDITIYKSTDINEFK